MSFPKPDDSAGHPAHSTDLTVDLAAASHVGLVRQVNEDHYLVLRLGRYLEPVASNLPAGALPVDLDQRGVVLLVADGMGGEQGGAEASCRAISLLVELALGTPDWILRLDEGTVERATQRAVERFRKVSAALREQAARDPRLAGMGTTMTMALGLGLDVLIAHVGDSPAYLARDGGLQRLTRNHTVAQDVLDRGIDDDVARRFRHVLSRALGARNSDPEIGIWRLQDGDRLLLCTDGLTDLVDESAILAELERHPTAAAACQALIDLALAGGGGDNVTVAIAGYRVQEPASPP